MTITNDEFIKQLQESSKLTELCPAQDYKFDKMWYSIKSKDDIYLINSTREFINIKDPETLESHGIVLTTDRLSMLNFSPRGARRFMNGEEVEFIEVFEAIHKYLTDYICLNDDRYYDVLALWVIGTYFHRCTNTYPYLHLHAPYGSGKSTLLKALSELAFNGSLSVASSRAASIRRTHANSATLFVDEFERERNKDSDFMGFLRGGNIKNGSIDMCKPTANKDWEESQFSCYSPKAIASIDNIRDSALVSRCIKIPIAKKPENVILCEIQNEDSEKYVNDLRDNLYILGLEHGSSVRELYLDNEFRNRYLLHNRTQDLWLVLIILAYKVHESVADDIYRLALEVSGQIKQEIKEADLSYRLRKALIEVVNRVEPDERDGDILKYSNENLYGAVLHYGVDLKQFITSKKILTQELNKFGMRQSTITSIKPVTRAWAFDKEIIAILELGL